MVTIFALAIGTAIAGGIGFIAWLVFAARVGTVQAMPETGAIVRGNHLMRISHQDTGE